MHDIQTSGTPYRNVPSPGRDLVYIPSFSWPYLGQNMRPLMEGLCWIFAAMTVGLHKAAAGLDPRYGWNNHPSGGVADETSQHSKRTETNATASHTRPGRDGRIVVGIVMERRGNHSPHRLIQGVLEGMDRSKFRLVVFSRDYVADYPAAGQAILQAAEEVVIFEWHPFVTGLADPFADRRLVEQAQARDFCVDTRIGFCAVCPFTVLSYQYQNLLRSIVECFTRSRARIPLRTMM